VSLPTLCTRTVAARELGIHPRHVWDYCARWPVLRAGLRVVRVTPGSNGRMRILGAALAEHAAVELLQGEPAVAS
jgi:hypothetical protein